MLRTFLPLLLAASLACQTVPTGFTIDTLVSGNLATPLDCCFLPDGRVLLANSGGTVSLYAGGTPVVIGTVPSVESGGERGLLSIAADPLFPANGYIYVYYSSSLDSFLHVDRFTCTGDLSNPTSSNLQFAASSRRAVLGTLPDNASIHNGGALRFGPDGMLYLGVGDDNDQCGAQSLTSQVACLLRMDVSSLGSAASATPPAFGTLDPGDNPLSANSDFSQLLLAYGLRNPFRMEIDPATGNIYIGDVGDALIEECSEYTYGPGALQLRNFGWPYREGNITGPGCTGGTAPSGATDPIASIHHNTGWGSIIGGPLYRNPASGGYGIEYEGHLFCHDYWAGQLRRWERTTAGWVIAPAVAGQPTPTSWGTGFTQVTSMRLGPDGCLYYTQNSWTGGELCRIRKLGPQNAVVAISGTAQRVSAGDAFPQPLVVRVFDGQGNPLAGGQVTFTVSGPATLSPSTQVLTNANGFAQVNATATSAGGAITVTAGHAGAATSVNFALYARKLTATSSPPLLVLQVANQTSAVPAQVPYVLLLSFPGSPSVPSPIGTFCIDPSYALAVVIEDSVGVFGGVSFSGTGAMGNPGLSKVYTVPSWLFAGQLMRFQAVGFDPLSGWFRSNCEQLQF